MQAMGINSDPETKRAYQREWLRRRREAWFRENGPCVRCFSWNNLELDHVDKSSKITHSVWSWSSKRRDLELSKCQVLCHSCHQEKTMMENYKDKHGTHHGYARGGCRCDECRTAHAVYERERRARVRKLRWK